jgi:hypothetical protein
MTPFARGQYVELYPTIPSGSGYSIPGGTRGIIDAVDPDRADGAIYLVGFLHSEKRSGERAWLRESDLLPA